MTRKQERKKIIILDENIIKHLNGWEVSKKDTKVY